MPELPDVVVYCDALNERIAGEPLVRVRIVNPFVLRTVDPPLSAIENHRVVDVRRLGKRIVMAFDGDLFLVIHLMVAGRFRWLTSEQKPPGRITLALLDFPKGTLALTDPHILSGIGNAYSDEILHRAKLSPIAHTRKLDDAQIQRLLDATNAVLAEWTQRLRSEADGAFPEKVTAFRPQMAVHGKFREPCPVCGTPVQRIVYADNECNYCPLCQTGGVVLADRALSRLLHKSWPREV